MILIRPPLHLHIWAPGFIQQLTFIYISKMEEIKKILIDYAGEALGALVAFFIAWLKRKADINELKKHPEKIKEYSDKFFSIK